jgi:hypothetical protein
MHPNYPVRSEGIDRLVLQVTEREWTLHCYIQRDEHGYTLALKATPTQHPCAPPPKKRRQD